MPTYAGAYSGSISNTLSKYPCACFQSPSSKAKRPRFISASASGAAGGPEAEGCMAVTGAAAFIAPAFDFDASPLKQGRAHQQYLLPHSLLNRNLRVTT